MCSFLQFQMMEPATSSQRREISFNCNTLSVLKCHATRGRREGWDTAKSPKSKQKSRGRGRFPITDLPVGKFALQPLIHPRCIRFEVCPSSKALHTAAWVQFSLFVSQSTAFIRDKLRLPNRVGKMGVCPDRLVIHTTRQTHQIEVKYYAIWSELLQSQNRAHDPPDLRLPAAICSTVEDIGVVLRWGNNPRSSKHHSN
ncbi:hypothetical protein T265_03338 [Opisthorchis viverrini]|uniref:Uncharacterized protein n=1 Tax=Opisthorchis viverrini TaxID=6198 RepID=A0A075AHN3_OPIVI|nr:hypothetical protein T265_03338 [Opisthorchis viverrini]KER30184.1 hypothetical protein T265_03338 [Opisthorchis viverrini]